MGLGLRAQPFFMTIVCRHCKETFPATREHFYAHPGFKKTGLDPICKGCKYIQVIEYAKKHPEATKARYKKCAVKPKTRYLGYQRSARYRKLPFEITLDQFSEIIQQQCYYCGDAGWGVDRKNNSLGYIIQNCVSCCSKCNFAKHKTSEVEFLTLCERVTNHQFQKSLKQAC